VLSQADILITMKLTASQDRDGIGAWIEGQADRQDGKRILGDLPRLQPGEGYLWAPGHGILDRVEFPAIRTFDSSRTPKRGERLATPRTLAEVDLTAIAPLRPWSQGNRKRIAAGGLNSSGSLRKRKRGSSSSSRKTMSSIPARRHRRACGRRGACTRQRCNPR
jgi:hypothetical protein